VDSAFLITCVLTSVFLVESAFLTIKTQWWCNS
jgi:hypothetical protein